MKTNHNPRTAPTVLAGTWRVSSYSTNGANGANCVEVGSWRTSTRSGSGPNGGNCVEVGAAKPKLAAIAVRDTKNRDGGTLAIPTTEWADLLSTIKSGSFDS